MARYNSVNTTTSVAGGTTISTPSSGLLTTLTGTGTVTIPNPILYTGQTQTFYNSTGSAITLNTPSGNFTGAGASGNGNLTVPGSSVVTVVSDGANYIVQAWIGGTITVGGTLTANGAVAMNPTGLNVSIQPTGTGTLTLSSGITGTLDNINIGSTIQGTGNFTTLSANGTVTFTANTAATAYNSGGALQVTGGVGIGGAVFVNNSIKAGSASSTNGSIILQGNYGNGALVTLGSEYNTGGPSLGYAVYPSSSAAGAFLSASGAASLQRAAYNMNGNIHNWYAGAAQTVAIGSSASLYNAMSLSTTALTVANAANVVMQNTTAAPTNSQSAPGYLQFTGNGWNTLAGSTQYQGQIALGGTYSGSSGSTEPAFVFSLAGTGNGGYNTNNGPATLTERVRITNYGFVGIGISAPVARLHVLQSTPSGLGSLPSNVTAVLDSSSNNYLLFRNSADNSTQAGMAFQDNNVGGFVVYKNASGTVATGSDCMMYGAYQDHIFLNGSSETIGYGGKTETMRIVSNGRVGIGTNTPAQALDVNGNIQSSASIVGPLFFVNRANTTDSIAANSILNLIEIGGGGGYNSFWHFGQMSPIANASDSPMSWSAYRFIFRLYNSGQGSPVNNSLQMMGYYYSIGYYTVGSAFSFSTDGARGYSTVVGPWITPSMMSSAGGWGDVDGVGVKVTGSYTVLFGPAYIQYKA
jgi:hypothetical protein